MPPKKPPVTPAPLMSPDTESQVLDELYRAEQRTRAALSLILGSAAGLDLTREELQFCRAAGLDDAARLREHHRAARAIALYRQCGSDAQRVESRDRLTDLEISLEPRLAQIRAEIETLTAEAELAARRLNEARADVERREAAVVGLRADDILPRFVVDRLADVRKLESNCPAAAVVREAETRKKMIAAVLKLSDVDQMKLHAQGLRISGGPDLLVAERGVPAVDNGKWATYCADLQAELPRLESDLASARAELSVFKSEAAALRNYWLEPEQSQQLEEVL